ncbi:MAG: tRNA (adenosine(37)-N6)-dimethylallyltransferase MiaA [Deltaproteobacteria bacterium]|nr:tRNA (adenosine(37)-N6)-dimethylallyltransferase MiaA [Deltaproteobacteria bacterium]
MGPTGTGKSDLAVAAALRLGGEVVNADSMQVYRGLAIGTAAPGPDQLAAVPHHLFGCLDPDEEPDAGWYARTAAAAIRDLASRGRVPIVVGGTFFWMRALFSGLDDIPEVPAGVRDSVRADLAREGPAALHARLAAIDPETASRLRPGDSQRVSRAIEVLLATGRPLSSFQLGGGRPAIDADVLRVAVELPRAALYARIEARVDRMIAAGIEDEVRAVLDAGHSPDCRPLRASSLAPVVRRVRGEIGAAGMRAAVAQSHRTYAKRQETWLRREEGLVRVDARDPEGALGVMAAPVSGGG